MPLYFEDYVKRFSGTFFFYGNATHAFKDVMVWLNRRHPKKHPNIIMPEYIPAKLYRTVLAAGFTPRFYEVYGNCEFDLEEIASLIDEQTTALFAIHYFGLPSELDGLRRLATAAGVYLIEDCAHTIASHFRGNELGSTGDCAIFSVRKMLLLPEGGFLVLNKHAPDFEPSYQKRVSSLYSLSTLFKTRGKSIYFYLTRGKDPARLARLPRTGYINLSEEQRINVKNISRVTEQYTKHIDLEKVITRRRENYKYLLENIKDLPFLQPLRANVPDGFTPYSLPVHALDGLRDKLRTTLLGVGIGCGAGWPESPFEARFTRTAALSKRLLELPIHQGINHFQLDRVIECLHEFGKNSGYN